MLTVYSKLRLRFRFTLSVCCLKYNEFIRKQFSADYASFIEVFLIMIFKFKNKFEKDDVVDLGDFKLIKTIFLILSFYYFLITEPFYLLGVLVKRIWYHKQNYKIFFIKFAY